MKTTRRVQVLCYACRSSYNADRRRDNGRGRILEGFSLCRCGAINADRAGSLRLAQRKSSKQRRARA